MTRVVAFTGPMGSGKSTAIKYLQSYLFGIGKSPTLVKFAQPLYDMQELIYQRIESVYERPSTFVKDRKLLQWLGTDWGRDTISRTLWVDLWKVDALSLIYTDPGYVVLCDDCRFDNEAEMVRRLGGVVIQLQTTRNLDRITTANGIKAHSSEAGINPSYVYSTVSNDGTINEFENSLKAVFDGLFRQTS